MSEAAEHLNAYLNDQPVGVVQDVSTLCACGKQAGTFACHIRHVSLNTGDAKAARD